MKSSLKSIFAIALITQMFTVVTMSTITADDMNQVIACKDCK